ncbi:hypothetical protein [Nostoc sp.]|uniref:hypothetical protein n=1 Tax=Nostoc sp. TaxID=1180 RepID=UPI002FF8ED9A
MTRSHGYTGKTRLRGFETLNFLSPRRRTTLREAAKRLGLYSQASAVLGVSAMSNWRAISNRQG